MDNPDTAEAFADAECNEVAQFRMGFRAVQAVQVERFLRAVFSLPELAEHRGRNAVAAEPKFVACLDVVVGIRCQRFLHERAFVTAALGGTGGWSCRRRFMTLAAFDRAGAIDLAPE